MNPADAPLFLIAGGGDYPGLVIEGARRAGVSRIVMAAFEGETKPENVPLVDAVECGSELLTVGGVSGHLGVIVAGAHR